ncbi:MAG: hypothetical protein HJJLKODD_01664 [Phycisphaerae bacterium]|nr:hypothetical protein [Phycisphaerae bacterium]
MLSVMHQPAPRRMTQRVSEVCQLFGILPDAQPVPVIENLALQLQPGTLTLLTGPSGCGKSSVLTALQQRFPQARAVHLAQLPRQRSIVDMVGARRPLAETLKLLTACALGEPRLWLRHIDELSSGEQFRATLAWCIDQQQRDGQQGLLLADEFGAILHRRAAQAIAYNLRKLVTDWQLTVVLATTHSDLVTDLQPDYHIELNEPIGHSAPRRPIVRKPISFLRRLEIVPGGKADYLDFAAMHYRRTDELGFVDCVFVLREKSSGEKLGIVVYSHPPLELYLRNKATNDRFKRQPQLLNREMRILRRLVVHPDVRGCGLGHYLVRKTLPRVGTPFIECLAGMGAVNPVFERDGMKLIGACPTPANRRKHLEALQTLGVDPWGPDFVAQTIRRPRVRRIVARLVYDWYQATTGHGEQRVARQSPEFLAQTFRGLIGNRPLYYLWQGA